MLLWNSFNRWGTWRDLAAIPFKVVPLCSDTPFPANVWTAPLKSCSEEHVKQHLWFTLDLLHSVKTTTLQLQFYFEEQKERSCRESHSAGGWVGGERWPCCCCERFVMLNNTFTTAPQFRFFSPNIHPWTPRKVPVVLSITSVTLREKFTVYNSMNVRGNHQHAVGCTPNLTCLLWSWTLQALSSEDCCLVSGLLQWTLNSHHQWCFSTWSFDHPGPVNEDPCKL